MLRALLIIAVLALAGSSEARERDPRVTEDVTYAVARAQMIKQGYDPVRVLKKKADYVCRYDILRCRRYPELSTCTYAGAHTCEFLFRRRSDGVYFVVTVFGEAQTVHELQREQVKGVDRTTDVDFEEIVIAKPARGGRARGP
jgi:hypothetical protein